MCRKYKMINSLQGDEDNMIKTQWSNHMSKQLKWKQSDKIEKQFHIKYERSPQRQFTLIETK